MNERHRTRSLLNLCLAAAALIGAHVSSARAQQAEPVPPSTEPAATEVAPAPPAATTQLAPQPEPQPEPTAAPAPATEPMAAPVIAPQPVATDEWAIVEEEEKMFDTRVYGYIDAHIEKVARTPASIDTNGNTVYENNPIEYDIPSLNVMVQGDIVSRYKYFLNLSALGAGSVTEDAATGVRNAWLEAPLAGDYLKVRIGKTYRRFGLYNEILDATPTFIGIEPPELFDNDHLMLTRTTNLMVHGGVNIGESGIYYSVATGADERKGESFPIGVDLHYDYGTMLRIGTSFYATGGDAVSSRAVGDGSPTGGVQSWMASDEYMVLGGYAQLSEGGFLLQLEYWHAPHDAVRDPDSTLLLADAGLNERQMRRFFVDGDPDEGVRNDNAEYAVNTFYVRAGYEIMVGDSATLTPYGQYDYYSNPETIANKDFGGDAEAGLADDGKFHKVTAGLVFRPILPVALKLDGSTHIQEFNDETEPYWEVRSSLSYLWDLDLN